MDQVENLYGRQRFVVGYVADARGAEALALGISLARGAQAELVVTLVVPEPSPYGGGPSPRHVHDPIVRERLEQWQREALDRVPEDVSARSEVRAAESEARGLLEAAEEHDASAIVVGARSNPLLQRFALGTTLSALLHSSPVPVALAPAGFDSTDAPPRLTAVYGTRPGASAVIGTAVEAADRRAVPLRLLTLLPGQPEGGEVRDELVRQAERFGGLALGERAEELLTADGSEVAAVTGADLDDAIGRTTWLDGEVALVGSSRLAPRGRVFIGGTAQRLLRRIPAAVVVVPRDYQAASQTSPAA
ncbi:universal stress protein [Herbiconiux sp. SYSU D00978]|uniref:universal stress protein n=1 Tax=Herbiconiux sp. SYSU D00978 TaxID=2812562 RepID=UPI0027DB48F9|nr:universal stress protein [Herbiconiux sp. SYSU D00978]